LLQLRLPLAEAGQLLPGQLPHFRIQLFFQKGPSLSQFLLHLPVGPPAGHDLLQLRVGLGHLLQLAGILQHLRIRHALAQFLIAPLQFSQSVEHMPPPQPPPPRWPPAPARRPAPAPAPEPLWPPPAGPVPAAGWSAAASTAPASRSSAP